MLRERSQLKNSETLSIETIIVKLNLLKKTVTIQNVREKGLLKGL